MDRDRALSRLAGAYGRALRLAEDGRDEAGIADELGIDVAAVRTLLHIGAEKLRHLMAEDDDDAAGGAG